MTTPGVELAIHVRSYGSFDDGFNSSWIFTPFRRCTGPRHRRLSGSFRHIASRYPHLFTPISACPFHFNMMYFCPTIMLNGAVSALLSHMAGMPALLSVAFCRIFVPPRLAFNMLSIPPRSPSPPNNNLNTTIPTQRSESPVNAPSGNIEPRSQEKHTQSTVAATWTSKKL